MQCITSKSTRTDSRQGGREDHDKNGEGRKKEGRKEAKAQSLNGRGKICTERERETGRETRDAVAGPAQSALKSASMSSVLCTLYWTRSSISRSLLSRLSRSLQLTVKTSKKAVGDDHLTASSDGHVWSRVVTGSHVSRRGRASEYECDLPGLDKRERMRYAGCRMQDAGTSQGPMRVCSDEGLQSTGQGTDYNGLGERVQKHHICRVKEQ